MEIYNEALEKFGGLNKDSLRDIQMYVKKQERLRPIETWVPKEDIVEARSEPVTSGQDDEPANEEDR